MLNIVSDYQRLPTFRWLISGFTHCTWDLHASPKQPDGRIKKKNSGWLGVWSIENSIQDGTWIQVNPTESLNPVESIILWFNSIRMDKMSGKNPRNWTNMNQNGIRWIDSQPTMQSSTSSVIRHISHFLLGDVCGTQGCGATNQIAINLWSWFVIMSWSLVDIILCGYDHWLSILLMN